MKSVQDLSNSELLENTRNLVAEEKRMGLLVLDHLREIETRSLYMYTGHSSLYDYTVKELGYSEDAAYRRISAMRLTRDVPQARDQIAAGAISLTVAAKAQKLFRLEKFPQERKIALLKSIERKSSREVEKEFAALVPKYSSGEKIRQLSGSQAELKVIIDETLREKLDHLKNLLSHKNPEMGYQELLATLVEIALQKLDPTKHHTITTQTTTPHTNPQSSGAPKAAPSKIENNPNSRHIPAALRAQIWKRDQSRCSHKDAKSGKTCGSRYLLQIDHIEAFAYGGKTVAENLRLLCAAHNRARAPKSYKSSASAPPLRSIMPLSNNKNVRINGSIEPSSTSSAEDVTSPVR